MAGRAGPPCRGCSLGIARMVGLGWHGHNPSRAGPCLGRATGLGPYGHLYSEPMKGELPYGKGKKEKKTYLSLKSETCFLPIRTESARFPSAITLAAGPARVHKRQLLTYRSTSYKNIKDYKCSGKAGDSIPQATFDGSDETNLFKTSPTEKNFNSGLARVHKRQLLTYRSTSYKNIKDYKCSGKAGDSIPQATLDGSDETNLFKTSPTEKNFNSGPTNHLNYTSSLSLTRAGNGQPPFRAAVNPEADQPDTPADPTPSRPPSPGNVFEKPRIDETGEIYATNKAHKQNML
uniref:Uncharacterized protein n=1 Tax=Oryza sativa subsp. japonica TaxID=39947 RepID=Q5W7B4_ORYSJ|nr:hypothetical protein [Oryza sativa Japonica Group]